MTDIASRTSPNDTTPALPALSAPPRQRRGGLTLALGALLALGVGVAWRFALPQAVPTVTAPADAPSLCIVAPGKIEAVDGERLLALDSSGIIRRIHVSEGATVEAGQLLVELVNDDTVARLDGARHDLVNVGERLRMLKNGPRLEEIELMRGELEALKPAHEYYEKILKSRQVMRSGGTSSQEEVLEFQMRADESRKRWIVADARLKLLLAGTRVEEIAMAVAAQAAAETKVKELTAVLERTRLRAPLPGKVLRLLHREGEAVVPIEATPLVLFADTRQLQVRAEIDETQVSLVRPGMAVKVKPRGQTERAYTGTVLRLMDRFGRKQTATDDPREKVDLQVLEVIIALPDSAGLFLHQRVDVTIDLTETTNLRRKP